jgi:streptomycin 6-kinase
MLTCHDADLVRRDSAIPGLATILDPDAFASALSRSVRGIELRSTRITDVKYRPGRYCRVIFQVDAGGTSVDGYADAYGPGDRQLYVKRKRIVPGPLGAGRFVWEDQAIVVTIFPNDHRLKRLRNVADAERWRRTLSELLPNQPDYWDGVVKFIRARPGRHYVAKLLVDGAARAALKFYAERNYAISRDNARAFRPDGPLRLAPIIGSSDDQRIVAFEWIADVRLHEALREPAFDIDVMATVGSALARLHAQDPEGLPSLTREDEAAALRSSAELLGFVCPRIAKRAVKTADRLAARLLEEPRGDCAVHGDFSPKQVLVGAESVTLLDLDGAVRSDPASDLGKFIAKFERDAVRGDGSPAKAKVMKEALLDGYCAAATHGLPPLVDFYIPIGLLRLAHRPFRSHRANWSEQTEIVMERAEAMADAMCARASGCTVPATCK